MEGVDRGHASMFAERLQAPGAEESVAFPNSLTGRHSHSARAGKGLVDLADVAPGVTCAYHDGEGPTVQVILAGLLLKAVSELPAESISPPVRAPFSMSFVPPGTGPGSAR